MYIVITGAMLPRNKKGWFIMTNEQMFFLTKAGAEAAGMAEHCFGALTDTNDPCDHDETQGNANARLFYIMLALHNLERAKSYFKRFLDVSNLSKNELEKIDNTSKETI